MIVARFLDNDIGQTAYEIGKPEYGETACIKEQHTGADPECRLPAKINRMGKLEKFQEIIDADSRRSASNPGNRSWYGNR